MYLKLVLGERQQKMKRKFRKLLAVALSASLMLGSVPLWGGGKAEAVSGGDLIPYTQLDTKAHYVLDVTDDGSKALTTTSTSDGTYRFNLYSKTGAYEEVANSAYYKNKGTISSDGRYLAWLESGTANVTTMDNVNVQLMDLSTNEITKVNSTNYGGVTLAFSPNGKRLAYSSGDMLYVYDIDTKTEVALTSSIDGYNFTATGTSIAYSDYVIFSPDSSVVYYTLNNSSEQGAVYKWDGTTTTKVVSELNTGSTTSQPLVLAVSPDEKYLVYSESDNGTIHVLNQETGTEEAHPKLNVRSEAKFVKDKNIIVYKSRDLDGSSAMYNLDSKELYYLDKGKLSKDGTTLYSYKVFQNGSDNYQFGIYDLNGVDLGNINFSPISPQEPFATNTPSDSMGYLHYKSPLFYEGARVKLNGVEIIDTKDYGFSYDGLRVYANSVTVSNVHYGSQELEVVYYNNAGEAEPVSGEVGLPGGKDLKFGQETVPLGAYVKFSNAVWVVAADNTIYRKVSDGSRPFSRNNHNAKFILTTVGSVARYLDWEFYNTFTDEEKSVIRMSTWQTYLMTTRKPKAYTVDAYVGMINYEMISNFPDGLNFSSIPWLMDAQTSSYSLGTRYENKEFSITTLDSNYAIHPAIQLVDGVSFSGGTGTYYDPYTINTSGVAKPAAPTNFKVTTDETSLTSSWDVVDRATGYKILVNDQLVYSGTNVSYTYTNLSPNTSYVVTLVAFNSAGESGQQHQTVKTKVSNKMPAPTGLKAETTHNSATISWDAVEDATAYWVMVDNDQVYNGSDLTVTVNNLNSDRPYTVYVRAVKSTGTLIEEGEQATLQIVTKPISLEAPGQPVVLSSVEGNVKITWPASNGALMYKVQRNGVDISSVASTEYTDRTAVLGQSYEYTVKAFDGTRTSEASTVVVVIVTQNGGGITSPGNEGGTTPPTTGGSTGGSTTTPAEADQNSIPGTVTDPKTEGEGSTGDNATEVENNTNFSDISGNFAEESIKHLTAAGILKGYADGTFGPNKKITRSEFAIMTKRAMRYENSGSYVQVFKDFDENAWYAEELLTALDSGITKGLTDGTYRPDVFILREQAAMMIANILKKNNFQPTVGERIFKDDKDIASWAYSSVYLLKSHKIIEGQNNFFYPKREVTRAEAAVMIYRMLTVLNK
ncbi:S-layer homology domain-containing protein [Paenibacillus amylolyticus]|uniref:S-layer homology domain-containing protein n=1 Tax=Paenibacillus amylolyticus TaxID=1451 RepID=UPI00201D8E3D|nr:S-layer homology domain-containing protein [Paenibacillus amylolyticus]MCL6663495.1 S-layer homology domain-containing protein [Paenibacillus amylolyticus]